MRETQFLQYLETVWAVQGLRGTSQAGGDPVCSSGDDTWPLGLLGSEWVMPGARDHACREEVRRLEGRVPCTARLCSGQRPPPFLKGCTPGRALAGDSTRHSALAHEVWWVHFQSKYRRADAPLSPLSLSHGLLQACGRGGPSGPRAISGESYLRGFTFTSERPNCACNNREQLLHNRAPQMKRNESLICGG